MRISELFLAFVRRLIFAFLLVLLIASAMRAHAQSGGTVGVYTREVSVFTNQSTTTHSAIFPDFGFGCNFLSYQTNGFTGIIDVEWAPPVPVGTAPTYIPLAQASYQAGNPITGFNTLQVGGYFPNMRSTVTPSAGSLSAQYTASAAPCPLFGAGLGSNGPTSPIVCDQSTTLGSIANGATVGSDGLGPILAGDIVVVCGFQWGFTGATSMGSIAIGWAPTSSCAGAGTSWVTPTTANTPQLFTILLPQRSSLRATQFLCVVNNSGAAAYFSVSWASVHGI